MSNVKLLVFAAAMLPLVVVPHAAPAQSVTAYEDEPRSFWPKVCWDDDDSCPDDGTIVVPPGAAAEPGAPVTADIPSFIPGSGGAAAITQPDGYEQLLEFDRLQHDLQLQQFPMNN